MRPMKTLKQFAQERNKEIANDFVDNLRTVRELSKEHDLTTARVYQILDEQLGKAARKRPTGAKKGLKRHYGRNQRGKDGTP